MPQQRKTRILTIGLPVEEFAQLGPWLDREEFDLDRFPSTQGAVELVSCQAVDVLLVRYTQPDQDLRSFLRTVRAKSSPCRHSPLLLLASRPQLTAAESLIGRGANRVVSLNGDRHAIQAAVTSLLCVAPRKACRFIAQLEFKIGKDSDWILCRAMNGSATGVLLETDRRIPKGTRVDFEFTLPAGAAPVVGRAEVTRHTTEGRESFHGLGMRFLSFAGDSRRSYEEFLAGRVP